MTDSPAIAPAGPSTELAIAPAAMAVLETLWAQGHAALVVGGAVRDLLLGLPTRDWDVATDARPERVLAIFPGGVYENRFGTVSVGDIQITTFRRDHRYADHRRPEFVTFADDAFEDLARRDLTINAIAWGRLRPGSAARHVDPADGIADLRAGIVRAVGDPDARFDEDALRMLRAVRIAAQLGFTVEPRTLQAIRDHAADVAWVSEERIGAEVRLMLASKRPSNALGLLHETGIFAVILPELDVRLGAGGEANAWLSALDPVVAEHPDRERLALAVLVSDLAQGVGQEEDASGPAAGSDGEGASTGSEDGDAEGATSTGDRMAGEPVDTVGAVLARLRIAQREAAAIARIVAAAREPYASSWSDADVRRYLARTRPELVEDALVLRLALARAALEPGSASGAPGASGATGATGASGAPGASGASGALTAIAGGREAVDLAVELRDRSLAQLSARVPLSLADLAIDGDDLRDDLGIPEGPIIGELLGRALDVVIEDPARNERAVLLGLAEAWRSSIIE